MSKKEGGSPEHKDHHHPHDHHEDSKGSGSKESHRLSTNDSSSISKGPIKEKRHNPRYTFCASILMVSSVGYAQVLAQFFVVRAAVIVGQMLILVLCIFTHEWNNVHGGTLTRRRRPHYDIANVLETYQPRARTEGHLFQPEPPTPGYFSVLPAEGSADKEQGKDSGFTDARDAHYAGMYTIAQQRNREMEMMDKGAMACSSLDAAQLENVVLTPADPAKDRKEFEEKKKKEAEDYYKQFEKPFSC